MPLRPGVVLRQAGDERRGRAASGAGPKIREKALGPLHPDFARSLNELAWLRSNQGRYADAEHLARRALTIREKALGPDHLDVAYTLNDLGWFLIAQDKLAEAGPLTKQGLADR